MMYKAWSSIEEVPYYFWGSSVKFLGHTAKKIVDFDPNWAFPDCNSSLNSPMGTKWCTKFEVAQKRCPIVLQGHPSNFTVTRAEKLTIWIQFEITRPVADIKSLRFALFEVTHQISRSHRLKNWQFQIWVRLLGRSQLSNSSDLPCLKEIHVCEHHYGKTDEWIFMKFLRKFGHETRKDLEHFGDVAVNSFDPGSIFLFSGSVFVSNIMEKQLNGFSWNFHDMSGMMQEVYI